jgi:single-strand DNA-binding protein
MIKLQIIGYLGKNAVQNEVNGKSVLNFSVAQTERFKNAQGLPQERTIWVECAMWYPTGVGPYLLQGTYVFVEGVPVVDTYNNSSGGVSATLRLRVRELKLLSGGVRSNDGRNAQPEVENPAEDLPF